MLLTFNTFVPAGYTLPYHVPQFHPNRDKNCQLCQLMGRWGASDGLWSCTDQRVQQPKEIYPDVFPCASGERLLCAQ